MSDKKEQLYKECIKHKLKRCNLSFTLHQTFMIVTIDNAH